MLNELQNIRKLLAAANPENIHAANLELEKLPAAADNLSKVLLSKHKLTRDDVESLKKLKAEISEVLFLSHSAMDYYKRFGEFLLASFAEYERTGQFRPLNIPARTIGQF
jgi:hypothetical protein